MSQREIEEGVEEIMEAIDEHHLSSSDAPRTTSIAFLKALISSINVRITAIKEEDDDAAGGRGDEEDED